MSFFTYFHRGTTRRILIATLLFAAVFAMLWFSSSYVIGFRTLKTARIIPANVAAEGWSGAEQALTRE
ncbi:MAG: hypothetical protein WA021_04760, partial [Minisyncoccia bacterium]